jgi:ABC-type branched-subunit amino acid transport system permease subunit
MKNCSFSLRNSAGRSILKAFPFVFFNEWLRSSLSDLPSLHLVIYGLLLILVMIFYPGGEAPLYYKLADQLRRARHKPAK